MKIFMISMLIKMNSLKILKTVVENLKIFSWKCGWSFNRNFLVYLTSRMEMIYKESFLGTVSRDKLEEVSIHYARICNYTCSRKVIWIVQLFTERFERVHCKKVIDFPIPSWEVTNQTLP